MATKAPQSSRHLLRQCSSLLNRRTAHHKQFSAPIITRIAHQTQEYSAFNPSEPPRRLLTTAAAPPTRPRQHPAQIPHSSAHASSSHSDTPGSHRNASSSSHRPRGLDGGGGDSEGMIPEAPRGPSDLSALDVLGNTPVPSSSIDVCMSDGFLLNSGAKTLDGSGVLLIGGEAFGWRPWELNDDGNGGGGDKGNNKNNNKMKLLNAKGQWHVAPGALGLLEVLWPRPDLLILGLGPEIRPISPELKKYISSLGLRVEILDTRNAASQYNLLATERGVNEVIAAMIPIGWREGVGAVW